MLKQLGANPLTPERESRTPGLDHLAWTTWNQQPATPKFPKSAMVSHAQDVPQQAVHVLLRIRRLLPSLSHDHRVEIVEELEESFLLLLSRDVLKRIQMAC